MRIYKIDCVKLARFAGVLNDLDWSHDNQLIPLNQNDRDQLRGFIDEFVALVENADYNAETVSDEDDSLDTSIGVVQQAIQSVCGAINKLVDRELRTG